MLNVDLDEATGICTLEPSGRLLANDFSRVVEIVDPYIEQHGELAGVMILAETFPGWADFSSMTAHMKFVGEHQKYINRVAVVSDATVLSVMPALVDHFMQAEVKHFSYEDRSLAQDWLAGKAENAN